MAVIATSKPQEDFIMELNGAYNLIWDELIINRDVVAGQVGELTADYKIGIASRTAKAGEKVRVMVRGNPTTVNAKALTGSYEDVAYALESVGIIVVNK